MGFLFFVFSNLPYYTLDVSRYKKTFTHDQILYACEGCEELPEEVKMLAAMEYIKVLAVDDDPVRIN